MQDIVYAFVAPGRRFGALLMLMAPFAALIALVALWPQFDPAGFDAVMNGWGAAISGLLVPGLPFYIMVLMPWWMPMLILVGAFAVSWHRRLLGDGEPFARPYALAVVFYALILVVAVLLAMITLVFALELGEMAGRAAGRPAAVAVLIFGAAMVILAAARLLPDLAAVAIGEPRLTHHQRDTVLRGRTLQIGFGLLILSLPIFVLMLLSFIMARPGNSVLIIVIRTLAWLWGAAVVASYASRLYARATGTALAKP